MTYEYDCWKCEEWHLLTDYHTPELTDEELQRINEWTGATIRNAETKEVVLRGAYG